MIGALRAETSDIPISAKSSKQEIAFKSDYIYVLLLSQFAVFEVSYVNSEFLFQSESIIVLFGMLF